MPGSPLAMIETFMQLPENEQALDLLRDMVSTDTFLYGEPSCVQFVELVQKIQRAQQAANILQMVRRGGTDFDFGLEAIDEDDEDDEDDGAAAPRAVRLRPVQFTATATAVTATTTAEAGNRHSESLGHRVRKDECRG